ncbi:MAG: metallophosphoesterase [Beijerinckiaceae bacterium]
MKFLVVADIHYSLPQFDWLLKEAAKYDLVIIAGDLLDVGSIVDFRAQTLVVQKYLQKLTEATRVFVCSGNHDLDSRTEAGEKFARWLGSIRDIEIGRDGDTVVIDDILFTICPWWDGPVVRENLSLQLAADSRCRDGYRWIWIHHAPPANAAISWSGRQSLGDRDLLSWIGEYRPDIVFSGHIHQSPFVANGSWADLVDKTWCFNAGHQFGSPPAYVAFDTELNEAVWVSAMGVQSVQLLAPLQRPIPALSRLPDWLHALQENAERL